MITFFNKLANSWFAKFILSVLAISMLAFFGLGGLANVSSYNVSKDVIKVGKTGVSSAQLMQSFEQARKFYSQMRGGQYVSPTEAIANGVMNQVLQQEIETAIQTEISEGLGLTASNEAIRRYIEKDKIYQDAAGNFDKNLFRMHLSHLGLNEVQMAHKLKKILAYKHFTDTVKQMGYSSEALAKASYAYKNEKRDIEVLSVTPNKIKVAQEPTQQDVQDYYEAYIENFMKPEYRTLNIVSLSPDMIADTMQIDGAEIDAVYEEQKDTYNKPEERDLYQMFFKTKEEADLIKQEVTTQNFNQLAQEKVGQTEQDTHFGMTSKAQLMEELSDVVFNASKGDIVGPIESKSGWHILWIKDIKKAETTPIETVKAKIKKTLAMGKAYDELQNLSRRLEDILGEGKDLITAAKELNLPIARIEKVDITGVLSDGKEMEKAYLNSELLQEVFVLKVGEVSGLIQNNDGFLVAQVEEITPVEAKQLSEVQDDIKALWIQEKQKEAFPKLVEELTQKVQDGADLKTLATYNGDFEYVDMKDVLRTTVNPQFMSVSEVIFAQETGHKNAQNIALGNGQLIVVVKNIKKADTDISTEVLTAELAETQQTVGQTLVDETIQGYVSRVGFEEHPDVFQSIIQRYQGQE